MLLKAEIVLSQSNAFPMNPHCIVFQLKNLSIGSIEIIKHGNPCKSMQVAMTVKHWRKLNLVLILIRCILIH
jgi:hypothetical protein